jgi:hypothetical protein
LQYPIPWGIELGWLGALTAPLPLSQSSVPSGLFKAGKASSMKKGIGYIESRKTSIQYPLACSKFKPTDVHIWEGQIINTQKPQYRERFGKLMGEGYMSYFS